MLDKFTFKLTGESALLMNQSEFEITEEVMRWQKDPANKNQSKAGDDRTPPWKWQACLYQSGERIVVPGMNISAALRYGGAKMTLKGKKTFKEASQSGILIEESCRLFVRGKEVSTADLVALRSQDFDAQKKWCEDRGFCLFVNYVKNPGSKGRNIRVRPKFDSWEVVGTGCINSPDLNLETVRQMFGLAGRGGIGDWRPSAKTPGAYGMFTAEIS